MLKLKPYLGSETGSRKFSHMEISGRRGLKAFVSLAGKVDAPPSLIPEPSFVEIGLDITLAYITSHQMK